MINNIPWAEIHALSGDDLHKASCQMIEFGEAARDSVPDGFWKDYKNPIRPLVGDVYHDSSTHILIAQNKWYEEKGTREWDEEIVRTSIMRLRPWVNMMHYIAMKEGWLKDG